MLLYPSAWTVDGHISSPHTIRVNGRDSERHYRVAITIETTYLLRFAFALHDDNLIPIIALLKPTSYRVSARDPCILQVRHPGIPDGLLAGLCLEVTINPICPLLCLYQARGIRPHRPFFIQRYAVLYSESGSEIRCAEGDIFPTSEHPVIPRALFFDIEVRPHSRSFPTYREERDEVQMISVITAHHSSLLVSGDISHVPGADQVYSSAGQTGLIERFISVVRRFNPDCMVHFNGFYFDAPYLERRAKQLGLPNPLRLGGMHLTEIDLYAYFRLFHPELASFSLDHIGRTFVGQGKTGMSTDELISIMRQPEPAAYARAGSYSLRDSVLLRELWQLLPIVANLQRLSDACGLSFTDLLRARPEAIVARLAYLIDPSTAYQPYKIRARDTHPVPAAGLFRDMVFYDYSELYRMALLNSPDPFTRQLGQALIGFPPVCLVAAYYSPYVQMVPPIDLGFGGSGVIRVGSWFCIGPAGLPLPICHRFAYVLSLGGSSYLAQTQEGQRHAYGTAWICKTPFPLVEELVQGYLSGTVSACPVVTAADWPKLVCTTVLRGGSHSNLSRHPDLVEQYAQPIVTWTKVSWVQTPQGRRLLDDTPPTPDLAYYQGRLGRYWTELASLGGKARPINPATSPRLTGLTLEVDRPA